MGRPPVVSATPSPVVPSALARLEALSRQLVPSDLLGWAERSHQAAGFPLLGTDRQAEPYVALQWNGERAARAGLGVVDLVVLTGVVTGWQQDRTIGDLARAVARALEERARAVSTRLDAVAPVTADVVTTAVCAGVLSGIPEGELSALVDLAGTLLQVRPAPLSGTALPATQALTDDTASGHTAATAAGHTAAAGWLAAQVHLAGMVAYPGAFAETVATAAFTSADVDTATP